MKMFARDMVLTGPPRDVRDWAVGIAAEYERVTGQEVAVWTKLAGGTTGHFSWTMPIGGAADIAERTMQALGDDDYLDMVEEGREFFVGQPIDTIYSFYNNPGDGSSQIGNVAVVTQAEARAGSLGHAVGWGLEAAEYVSRITGHEVALMGHAAGKFSKLTWMSIVPDAAAADAADERTSGDDEYLKLIARGGSYFVSGSAHTHLFIRIG